MIKITLDVTTSQLKRIIKVLEGHDLEADLEPVYTEEFLKVAKETASLESEESILKPGGAKATKMPSFGRTPSQVAEFVTAENDRVRTLTEKEEEKLQRKEEKELLEAEKQAEVKAIIEATHNPEPVVTPVKKLWA